MERLPHTKKNILKLKKNAISLRCVAEDTFLNSGKARRDLLAFTVGGGVTKAFPLRRRCRWRGAMMHRQEREGTL